MSKKISDEELLVELKRICNLLNRASTRNEIDEMSIYSSNAYKRAFGNLTNVMIKLGIVPTFIKNQTKDDVISEIKRLYNELKRIPTAKEFNDLSSMSFNTMRSIVKGQPWHSLLQEAGISDDEIRVLHKKGITDDDLKNEIIRMKNLFGRYPTYEEMNDEGKFSPNSYETRFGSWAKAYKALGFTDYVSQSIYKNQIHTPGKDGTTYKSHFEARVADILFNLKQENKILSYEYERKVCEGKTWTCDFVVNLLNKAEIWVELDGMMKHRKDPYNGDNNEKINYYKQNNLNYKIFEYRSKGMMKEFVKFIGI